MKGLEILVTISDLVLKQEERLVRLFVMFKDKKYGTKYVIFTDTDNKNLYYGNPLVNGKKMVIMKFKDIKDEEMVKEYVWNFLNNESTSNFETIEIPELDKLEIIDNNTLDAKEEYVEKLIDIYFKKVEVKEEVQVQQKKKSIVPFFATLLIILGLAGGFLYLKNHPELIYGKDIYVECKKDYKTEGLNVTNKDIVTLTFNNSRILKKHEKEIVYIFENNDEYYDFKEKNLQYEYIQEEGLEKFIDEELTYKLFINYNLSKDYKLPKDYDELFEYYNNINYSCSIVNK